MNEIDFSRLDKKVAALCDEDAAEVCAQYAARQKLETEAIFFSDMRGGARTLMEHCLLHEVEAEDSDQREAFANCPANSAGRGNGSAGNQGLKLGVKLLRATYFGRR